jgi:septal ring factor EnvC (AmiA/AmiB activator)/transglutaminase-like putative cysteine protease
VSEKLSESSRAAHQVALWPLAAAAPIPLPWTEVLDLRVLIAYEALILFFYLRARAGRPVRISNTLLNVLAVLYVIFFYRELRFLHHGLVKTASNLLLFTTAAKFGSLRTARDESMALLLSFFLALDSASTSTHVASLLYLFFIAVVAFRCLARVAVLSDFDTAPPPRFFRRVPSPGVSVLAVVGIGALAIPLFVSLPRLQTPFATAPVPKETLGGSFFTSDRVDLTSFATSKRSDRILLRVQGAGELSGDLLRLRETTFNRYSDGRWTREGMPMARLANAGGRVDIPPIYRTAAAVSRAGTPAALDIEASSMAASFLFVPYGSTAITGASAQISIASDATLSPPGPIGGQRYRVEYLSRIEPAGPGRVGVTLRDVPPEVAELADRITAGARTHSAAADRLVKYLGRGFLYRLDPPPPRGEPVADFLLRTKQGHCEYFASALALMMRAEGIPARLATGSLGGEIGPFSSEVLVRGSNLHAWVEADVDGRGFRVFDPTPVEGRPSVTTVSVWKKLSELGNEIEFFYDRNILGFSSLEQVQLIEMGRDALARLEKFVKRPKLSPALGIVLFLPVAIALAVRMRGIRSRRSPPGVAGYLRLRGLHRRRIGPLTDSSTSSEVVRGFATRSMHAGVLARRLVELYRAESFGSRSTSPVEAREVRQLLSRLRREILRTGVAAGIALALAVGAARGDDAKPAADSRRQDLERLQARVADSKKRLSEAEKKTATLQQEIEALDLKLETASRQRELIAARREDLSRHGRDIVADLATARVERDKALLALRSRVLLLSRLGRLGYLRVLLSARETSQVFLALKTLDGLAQADASSLARFTEAGQRLEADLRTQTALAAEAEKLYSEDRKQEAEIGALKQERVRLLSRSRTEAAQSRQQVAVLSDKAQKLESLLDLLSRGDSTATGSPRPWKGVLDWPARGSIAVTFGRHRHPRFEAWTQSNGIEILAPEGSTVSTVYSGKVVFARWFADYGNMAVIDHGDEVLTLYARLRSILVRVGEVVSTGDRIGLIGVGPGESEPSLYFEVRDHQKATDPLAWLR